MLTFHIITLFPKTFTSYLGESIIARAIRDKKIAVKCYNPRDFTPHKLVKSASGGSPGRQSRLRERVDRRPYGGGPGMVLEVSSVVRAVEKIYSLIRTNKRIGRSKIVLLSAGGKQFNNTYARNVARKVTDLILVSGRYEGVDARVKKIFKAEELSVGPYVLTGGELPAATMVDAIARFVPGVLGKAESLEASRISSPEVYTRPEVLEWKKKKYKVPAVLLSGHHAKIDEWKKKLRGN